MPPQRKGPKTKGKPIVRNTIENRDNYKRWPWTSFLVLGLSSGSIFFMAGSPGEITETSGMSFALSLIFLMLGTVMLVPSVIVVLILFWYCFLNAIGTQVPEKCQCLYWFAIKNKKVSQSINFYDHKAKEPSIWTIESQMKKMKATSLENIEATALHYQSSIEVNNNDEETVISSEPYTPVSHHHSNTNHLTVAKADVHSDSSGYTVATPEPIRIRIADNSFSGYTNRAYSPDGEEEGEQTPRVHSSTRKNKLYKTGNNSDGWEERLIDETSPKMHKKSPQPPRQKIVKPRSNRLSSDRESLLSNNSDRNSVLTGKSDVPSVYVHLPKENQRTKFKGNNEKVEMPVTTGNRDQLRNPTSKGNSRENGRRNQRYPDSDKLSLSSLGSYLSPKVQRSQPQQNKQHASRPKSPNRMDDIVLATQNQRNIQNTRHRPYRSRPKPRYGYRQLPKKAPVGTTPDKTVFPEKITLSLKDINIVTKHYAPKMQNNLSSTDGKGNGLNDDVFINEDDAKEEDEDDVYSTSSSWIGIPWNTYKLPPGFQDPNADDELSV